MRQSKDSQLPSSDGQKTYAVDLNAGCCTDQGIYGRFCKHLMGVLDLFGGDVLSAPKAPAEDRHKITVLALGSAAQPKQFYR